jgi:micrococcal nuclease
MWRFAWCAVVLGLALPGAWAQAKKPERVSEIAGTVTRVIDGDTLWVKVADDQPIAVIRIEGVDAPESCQDGGKDATQALARWSLNKPVRVKVAARDEHSRWVGKVFEGQTDLGEQLVRDGHAWSQRYKWDRGPYVMQERMAQTLKRGVHAAGGAVNPREFRKTNGPCQGANIKPPAPAVAAPSLAAASSAAKAGAAPRCDGRLYCNQMRSCEEANWFLKNCPGVKMDGNKDGKPCEQVCGKLGS